ncbi:hypothetical protein BJ165DRAFT_1527046 [Panaeolus papilionaceus]|nr:hypothetical protein BJ165DRAFT_1527046 [Panaeolus papilionaceus]
MASAHMHNVTASSGPLTSMGYPSPNTSGVPAGMLGGIALLPNPLTPFALLPPDVARQYIVAMFVLVASLTVLLWDILNNLRSDYVLLTQRKIGLPTVVYFFSRISNLVYLLGEVIVTTAPIGNCKHTVLAGTALLPLAIPSTTLLLFFQVRAIYIRNRLLILFFGLTWLAVVAACAVQIMAATTGTSIGPTKYCIQYSQAKPYSAAPAIVVLVNDTLMFLAVVYKVLQCSMDSSSNIKTGFKTFVFGTSLPTLSKALLQNGQAYFLSTVGISLITVITFYISSIPPIYRVVMGFPDIALMNIMASRIYRNTKLGIFNLPTQSPNSLNNNRVNRSHEGEVVINISKKLEKSPPSMETLNAKCSAAIQLDGSSAFNDSILSPTTVSATSTLDRDYGRADLGV